MSRHWLYVLAAIATATFFAAPTTQARADYCVTSSGDGGERVCGFATFEQCLISRNGLGGWCEWEPMSPTVPAPRKRRGAN